MEDALDPDARAELERHVRDCGPCLTYLRTYERSRRLVCDATRNDRRAQPSEHMTERLRAFLLRRPQVERLQALGLHSPSAPFVTLPREARVLRIISATVR